MRISGGRQRRGKVGQMGKSGSKAVNPSEVLTGLRQFLNALRSGKMKVRQGGRDGTKREIENLELDIAFAKEILRQRTNTS